MSHKSKLLRKILVLFLGCLFCLSIFEVSLRIASHFNSTKMTGLSSSASDEFTILCLGESTTAPWVGQSGEDVSYPALLQEILNKEAQNKKFKVINAAVSGSNSAQILSKLDDTIKNYQPQLITAQIGINDWGDTIAYKEDFLNRVIFWGQNLKTYKLFRNMFGNYKTMSPEHLSNFGFYRRFKSYFSSSKSNTPSPVPSSEITKPHSPADKDLDKGTELILAGNTNEAIHYHQELLKKYPQEVRVYQNLSQIYDRIHAQKEAMAYLKKAAEIKMTDWELWSQVGYLYTELKDFKSAQAIFQKVLKNDPKNVSSNNGLVYVQMKANHLDEAEKIIKRWQEKMPMNYEAHLRLCRLYEVQMRWNDMIEACTKANQHNPPNAIESHFKLARAYTKLEKWTEAQNVILSLIKQKEDPRYFYELAQINILQKRFDKVDEYQQKGRELELKHYPWAMRENLKKIVEKIEKKRIPLAIVQYATRDGSIIKKMLEPFDHFEVIESKNEFSEAFKTHSYDDLFIDNFAGDFGHASKLGNSIIARNIAHYILKNYDHP